MHPILQNILSELEQLAVSLAGVPQGQPFGPVHGNWTFPGLTSEELRERVDELSKDIRDRGKEALDGSMEARLADYPRRLSFLRGSTVPQIWGNSAQGVPAFLSTLDGLTRALKGSIESDTAQDASSRLSKLRHQVGGLENRLRSLQPRTVSLEEMVKSIEDTYSASQELPSSLEDVALAKEGIGRTQAEVNGHLAAVKVAMENAGTALNDIQKHAAEAKNYLEGCEAAYRSSVAQGLAAAFQERSEHLNSTMWRWVAGLVVSLAAGVLWGGHKIQELAVAAQTGASPSLVALNAVMAIISVAAPVWLAWLSTRQIGQTFRLAEDYAYKASVARSYEGYRKEAQNVNDALVAELLTSAIRRVDEPPLRVVESGSPGSPWHDLASSPVVTKALNTIPDFGSRVRELAGQLTRSEPPAPAKSPEVQP